MGNNNLGSDIKTEKMKIFQFLVVALGMGSPVINPGTGVYDEKITSKDVASDDELQRTKRVLPLLAIPAAIAGISSAHVAAASGVAGAAAGIGALGYTVGKDIYSSYSKPSSSSRGYDRGYSSQSYRRPSSYSSNRGYSQRYRRPQNCYYRGRYYICRG